MQGKFKKSLLIFTIILVILSFLFLTFVYFNLKKYENNLLEPFLINTINKLDKKTLTNYLRENNLNENLVKTYQKLTKNKNFTFLNTDTYMYDAYLDGQKMFTINVSPLKEEKCLGLLKYEKYEVLSITPYLENGLIYKTVIIPSNYKLYVNGNLYTENKTLKEIDGMDFMYYNDNMPKMSSYVVKNLLEEPHIEIRDFNDKIVNYINDNNTYKVENFLEINDSDAVKSYIGDLDILSIAKDWSLFLTKDLNGASYGFENFKKYLLADTLMYKKAYDWAHSIDITFTSSHTLKNPPFTNEKVENFTIYGENAFSCEVYLEKHMIVKGNEQVDIMHDKLFFIKDNGSYYLMNIKSVTEGAYNE